MSSLKMLIDRFEALVASVGQEDRLPDQLSAQSSTAAFAPGLSEAGADQAFKAPTPDQQISEAENACLAFQATTTEERDLQLDFLLARVRQLTDEHQEFDHYAKCIKRLFDGKPNPE
ncbi:MAG: hypothetical protein AAFV45_08690 [Pseudomonadota bacterium]